ncbi:guanine-N1--methyltransferase, partial [Tilletiopsis washingtonensis]
PPRFAPNDVVYLTPDTDETLDELEEGKLYVIGGIVDRNRHKHLCLERAKALGVRVARLPIDAAHLGERALAPRAVLTVNQVFDILLGWIETREWGAALDRGLPSRK